MIKLYGYNNIILYTCEYIYYALDDHCITYMSLCAGFAIVKHKIYKISINWQIASGYPNRIIIIVVKVPTEIIFTIIILIVKRLVNLVKP